LFNPQYLIVATSEAVANFAGPADMKGNRATTRERSSMVKMNTLLKPPSFLSQFVINFAPLDKSITFRQSSSKLKSM
jgi:hypothetical protein